MFTSEPPKTQLTIWKLDCRGVKTTSLRSLMSISSTFLMEEPHFSMQQVYCAYLGYREYRYILLSHLRSIVSISYNYVYKHLTQDKICHVDIGMSLIAYFCSE